MPVLTNHVPALGADQPRPVLPAMGRGLACRCPACGQGRLFAAYLKIAPQCASCGEVFSHHRADDAPPYFTILIVGHVMVPLVLMLELWASPPLWVHAVLWIPLTTALALLILPRVKGALVALQWALRMHGFGESEAGEDALWKGAAETDGR